MEKLRIVTTSWDDGERTDLRIAEMLQSRGVRGTFYVPVHAYQGRPALSHADLRQLSIAGFEIGAHTVSHKLLWGLSSQELAEEIDPCKPALEDILGSEVRMFCYPCGRCRAYIEESGVSRRPDSAHAGHATAISSL
jgi:peptidoglycan/xylan/chitin deacetylase (PgdA/CDA1 family)